MRHDEIGRNLQQLIDAGFIRDYEANNPGKGKRWHLQPAPGHHLFPTTFKTPEIEMWLAGVWYAIGFVDEEA
jgi:hypothetical protein